MPVAATLTILAAQQVPEAQTQAAALPDDAVEREDRLVACHEEKEVAEVVRLYEELIQHGYQPSVLLVAAATYALRASSALGQHDKAASVVDALRQQGHQPQGKRQLEWEHAYYGAGRYDAVRDELLQTIVEDPRAEALRLTWLCQMHVLLGEWDATRCNAKEAVF
jgi:hypothetical protein